MEKTNDIETISGLSMFAKLKTPEKSNNPEYQDKWTIDVLLNQSGLAKAAKLGLKVRNGAGDPKPNTLYKEFAQKYADEGFTGEYVRLTKNALKKSFDEKGEPNIIMSGKDKGTPIMEPALPVKIKDSKGNEIPHEDVPLIGNGSRVAVSFALTKSATATHGQYGGRMTSVKIEDLVVYTPPTQDTGKGSYVYNAADDDSADEGEYKDLPMPKFAQ